MHKLWPVISLFTFTAYDSSAAPCNAPTVKGDEVDKWSADVVGALLGEDACYADKTALANSDCNIFVGRVLERLYKIKDFVLEKPTGGLRYEVSNDIAVLLLTKQSDKWESLGTLDQQSALDTAQKRAAEGKAVVAIWRNSDDSKPGHIALIGPGPLTSSTTLKVRTPVSASFFQGKPGDNYIGKPLACAFTKTQAPKVTIYARK